MLKTKNILLSLFVCLGGLFMTSCNEDTTITPSPDDFSNITDRVSSYDHFSELERKSATTKIKNGDFETGDLSDWYEKDALESPRFEVSKDSVDIWDNPINKNGEYYFGFGKTNYLQNKEERVGSIRSSLFVANAKGKISFRISGNNSDKLKLCLKKYNETSEDETIATFNNVRYSLGNLSGFIMVQYYYFIPENLGGSLCYLEVVDEGTTEFGFMNLDAVVVNSSDTSPIFVSSLASFQNIANCDEVLKLQGQIVSIDTRESGKRTFLADEDYSSEKLKVYAIYETGVMGLLKEEDYALDHHLFKKGVKGEYSIQIALKNTSCTTSYMVKVLDQEESNQSKVVINQDSKVIIFGDSLTAFWTTYKTNFSEINKITNIGIGGTKINDWMGKIDAIAKSGFTDIIMILGVNDVLSGSSTAKEIKDMMSNLLDKIHTLMPTTNVFLYTIFENPCTYCGYYDVVHDANIYYKQMQEERNYLHVVDCENLFVDEFNQPMTEKFVDGLHFQSECYIKISAELKKLVDFK
jgi:lysophospholipase L1-like esterase